MISSHDAEHGHIVVLPPSIPGASYFLTGDIHGNLTALKKAASLLATKGDTLLVVGDLTDRGDSSLETIKFIQDFNAANPDFQIRSIRGNHEDLCLDEISSLEKLAALNASDEETKMCLYLMNLEAKESRKMGVMLGHKAVNPFVHEAIQQGEKLYLEKYRKQLGKHPSDQKILRLLHKSQELTDQYTASLKHLTLLYQNIMNHSVNGGKWLSQLFIDEFNNGVIKVNGNGAVLYDDASDVMFTKKYMSSLPYIMHVPDVFTVVHADMPFNNEELQKRIKEGRGLSKDEMLYATLARTKDRMFKIKAIEGCDPFSLPIYCGHTEKGGVRPETNTFNVDIGTHSTDTLLVVNHTKRYCQLVTTTGDAPNAALVSICANTQAQLDKQDALTHERQKQVNVKSSKAALPTLKKAPSAFFYTSSENKSHKSTKIEKVEFKK